ncbi:hypothetical protein Scep_012782 [Stephania cephalantha]|uniref:Uncharacterized protein n=1 Tax=Stephania cephalantha TaxID=152367 RepID=A0AAP0P7W7_9MAGN
MEVRPWKARPLWANGVRKKMAGVSSCHQLQLGWGWEPTPTSKRSSEKKKKKQSRAALCCGEEDGAGTGPVRLG